MTVIFSSVSPEFIVMTSDSAITNEFSDHNEYDTGAKSYVFDGIGCVTTWGERSGNKIGRYLAEEKLSASTHSVEDLATYTNKYLTEEYRPSEYGLDEVGYHVGGFDRHGKPRLYHVFWGLDRPRQPQQIGPEYRFYPHDDYVFLYNGRNDLADTVVRTLLIQLKQGLETHYKLSSPIDRVKFCDFVVRFSAEITPQVGPPIVSRIIFPNNTIETVVNSDLCPATISPNLLQRLARTQTPSQAGLQIEDTTAQSVPTGTRNIFGSS